LCPLFLLQNLKNTLRLVGGARGERNLSGVFVELHFRLGELVDGEGKGAAFWLTALHGVPVDGLHEASFKLLVMINAVVVAIAAVDLDGPRLRHDFLLYMHT
jgi:hypothetical protein